MTPSLEVEFEQRAVVTGNHLNASCTAAGIPVPVVEWLKDGTPVNVSNGDTNVTETVQTANGGEILIVSTLRIGAVGIEDAGIYHCLATNDFGSKTQAVVDLIIHGECLPLARTRTRTLPYVVAVAVTVPCLLSQFRRWSASLLCPPHT